MSDPVREEPMPGQATDSREQFLRILAYQNALTPRCYEVLVWMRDNRGKDDIEDGEMVYERGRCYIGTTAVAARTFWKLLRACAISRSSDSEVGKFERYRINETGLRLIAEVLLAEVSPDAE